MVERFGAVKSGPDGHICFIQNRRQIMRWHTGNGKRNQTSAIPRVGWAKNGNAGYLAQ